MSKFISKVTLLAAALMLAPHLHADPSLTTRCNEMRYPFVLNKANVNALVALSCAGLSHNENERKNMTYEDSATMFHQWSTTGDETLGIKVEGYCAVSLNDLKEANLDRHKISLQFHRVSTRSNELGVKVDGTIDGKSLALEFSNNHFLDGDCDSGEAHINRLQSIALGTTMGLQSIVDMIRSQRTGFSLNLLDNENWIQGRSSGDFSGIGLQYRMAQWNGRQLGFAASGGSSGTILNIRSANILDYAEAGNYFAFNKDSFGASTGFQDENQPNNHKFQSYSIVGGAQVVGCSSLIFDGELDTSVDVDLENCKRHIEQSALQKFAHRHYESSETRQQTQEEKQRVNESLLIQKAQNYLNAHYLAAKNYSDRPGIYETGRIHWSKEDESRGYVVVERDLKIDIKSQSILVYEHRTDSHGKASLKRFSIAIAGLK